LCKLLERADLARDPALATNALRVAVRPALVARLGETLKHHRIDTLAPQLEAAGLPYARIVRPDQLLEDPHLLASGGLVPMETDDGGRTEVVLLPLLMDQRRLGVRRPLARAGEHTEEVLAALARPEATHGTDKLQPRKKET
ncbi:MAG TPA: CoA transferase, partial [Burkholderiaceae bacterium]|nr:CoA transferase [Burkholderiaceae bacterium]